MLDSNNKHPPPNLHVTNCTPPGASHHLLRGGAGRLGAANPGALRRCDQRGGGSGGGCHK